MASALNIKDRKEGALDKQQQLNQIDEDEDEYEASEFIRTDSTFKEREEGKEEPDAQEMEFEEE